MIQDQETLVASMSQQGISEGLIRRHFDRLVEEQCRQLRTIDEHKKTEGKKAHKPILVTEKIHCHATNVICPKHVSSDDHSCLCKQKITCEVEEEGAHDEEQHGCSKHDHEKKVIVDSTQCTRLQKVEPSSLLKIRMQKEVINAKKRNNGLQEDVIAQEIIKSYKFANDNRRCVSDDECNYSHVRLNGIQERKSELENYASMCTAEKLKVHDKQSFNGLENTRNPDNPQLAPKSLKCHAQRLVDGELGHCYPAQKHHCHNHHHHHHQDHQHHQHHHQQHHQHHQHHHRHQASHYCSVCHEHISNCRCEHNRKLPHKKDNHAHTQAHTTHSYHSDPKCQNEHLDSHCNDQEKHESAYWAVMHQPQICAAPSNEEINCHVNTCIDCAKAEVPR